VRGCKAQSFLLYPLSPWEPQVPSSTDKPTKSATAGLIPTDHSGTLLDGRYRLLERIAVGGMGEVYRGRHELMRREVAVKLLADDMLEGSGQIEGFKREIDAIAEIDHPNIIEIYDAGYCDNVGHYAAMRMLTGVDLAERIAKGAQLTILEILQVARQTGRALAAIHEKGIIHRDVKPENIFLAEDGDSAFGWTVRVLDFGVSMVLHQVAGSRKKGKRSPSVAGTPYTMSPEQIRGKPLDPRTDIYSFGILLFELFTGRYPFRPDSVNELLRMQVLVPAPNASTMTGCDWIPRELDSLIGRMLAKNRDERPSSMRAVLRELDRVQPNVTKAWAEAHLGDALPSVDLRHRGRTGDRFRTLQLIDTDFVITRDDLEDVAPRRRPSGSVELVVAPTPDPEQSDDRHERFVVAIVDDEPAIRMLVQMVCTRAGCDNEAYESGEAMLGAYDPSDPPDAVILDLLMPGIDGVETLTRLRDGGYVGPVIICSTLDASAMEDRLSGFADVTFMDKVIEFNRMRDLLLHWANLKAGDSP